MKTITFHCETITPMFLAGADGQKPELRPPSIKGAMRFWWRAMNGHLPLPELKKREGEIFGNGGDDATRSNISIDITPNELNKSNSKLNGKTFNVKGFSVDILNYLAYGTNSYKKDLKSTTFDRDYIQPNQNFCIEVLYNEVVNQFDDIINPFIVLSRIGGLGSKTRNGFGKFNIKKAVDEKNTVINLPHISTILKKQGTPKSYMSFSGDIKVYQLEKNDTNALNVLSDLGLIYKNTREQIENKHEYYKRSFLASPLQVKKKNEGLMERHAKSYFLSVSKTGDKYKGYIYYIPYDFLKGFDEDIDFNTYKKLMNKEHEDFLTDNQEQVTEVWFNERYIEVHNLFNGLLSQKMRLL